MYAWGWGGVRLVASLRGGVQHSSAPIIPWDPNLPRGITLGVVEYGVLGPVIQAPARGRPTIVGGLQPSLPREKSHLSLRTEFLPIPADDPHSPILCARPLGDGVGGAAASNLSPVPSPVIPYGVIRLVCRELIVFVVVVVVALKISTLHTL